MNPFEPLYGRCCNTPIGWSDPLNMVLIGLYMFGEMEHEMQVIKKNIKVEEDINKIFVDHNMMFEDFEVGEQV